MKTHLRRLTALLVCVLLLCACGTAPETTAVLTEEKEDATGRYYLVGTAEKAADELNEENYLRLKDDGKAIYQLTYDQLEYKWKLKDDGTLTLTLEGEKTAGTLADGVIRIRLDSRDLVFVKGRSAARDYIEAHRGEPAASTAEAGSSAEAPTAHATEAPTETSAQPAKPFDPDIRFSGTDQYGNAVDENVFREHVLTMINFWEPWCGPCVGEMPELEKMYQDRGGELLILGVYWTEDGAAEVLSQTGITYPVILFDEVFEKYQTGYVPTTIFVDPGGHVIGSPYVGARSLEDWNEIVKAMIGH